MWAMRRLYVFLSILLITAISGATVFNPVLVRNADTNYCSGNEKDARFSLEVAPAAIIASNNGQNRQTGIQCRKISLVYGLISTKALNQEPVLWAPGNHISLSALVTKFKSPSLFALHSCLTV